MHPVNIVWCKSYELLFVVVSISLLPLLFCMIIKVHWWIFTTIVILQPHQSTHACVNTWWAVYLTSRITVLKITGIRCDRDAPWPHDGYVWWWDTRWWWRGWFQNQPAILIIIYHISLFNSLVSFNILHHLTPWLTRLLIVKYLPFYCLD